MDYNKLNEINKFKMRGMCNNDEHFEWEDNPPFWFSSRIPFNFILQRRVAQQ